MRTVEIEVYAHADLLLPENAAVLKAVVRNWGGYDSSHIFGEAKKTIEAFLDEIKSLKTHESWFDPNFDRIEDGIMNLKGLRLRTWLINNLPILWKGKYYSLWSKTEVSFKHRVEGYPVLKNRYSKVFQTKDCNLTGMCYDMSLLNPIYEFIEKPNSDMGFEELINDCFASLQKVYESEIEYWESEKGILDEIQSQGLEFDDCGNEI